MEYLLYLLMISYGQEAINSKKKNISRIRSIFEVGKEAVSPFKYIGLNLS